MDLDPESGPSKQFGVGRNLKDSLQRQQVEDLFREYSYMSVSLNGGKTPKMDGEKMENPIKIGDLGVPLFLEAPIYSFGTVSTRQIHNLLP